MRRGRDAADVTGQTVTSDALGDEFFLQVLSEIDDKRELALLFAYVALDLPPASLARTFGQERKVVEATIASTIDRLKRAEGLRSSFSDIRRARLGRPEHYLGLAARLGLQDWFCAHCRRFIVQPAVGRPRITCSESCRKKRNRAKDTNPWSMRSSSAADSERPPSLLLSTDEAEAMRDALRRVIRNLDSARDMRLSSIGDAARTKAIILLGFTCPVQMSPVTLTDLNTDDVIETRKGIEILFYWGANQVRQYVTISPDPERAMCPVRAVKEWRALIRQHGHRREQLFKELGRSDEQNRAVRAQPLSTTIVGLIEKAVIDAGLRPTRELRRYDLLPSYLKELAVKP